MSQYSTHEQFLNMQHGVVMPELQDLWDHHRANFLMQSHKVSLFLIAWVQWLHPTHQNSRWGMRAHSSQCQGYIKGKTTCMELHALALLVLVRGYTYVAVGSKWRDFCNFPQKHLLTIETCLSSFCFAVLRSLESQPVWRSFVAFLRIFRYMGWGAWVGCLFG